MEPENARPDRPTVVMADDYSPPADVAWLWVNSQQWTGWSLDVIHVEPLGISPPLPDEAVLAPWDPEPPRHIFAETEFATHRFLRTIGDPRAVFDEVPGQLLVVGPTGSGFLKRTLHLGSTTEWLIHRPPMPMLIARSARPVRTVLVGIDASEPSSRAIDALIAMPWIKECHVRAVAVYDGWNEAGDALKVAEAVLTRAGISNDVNEVRGKATATLLDIADRNGTDLIAIGVRGTSTLHRAIAVSSASALSRVARCSVLIAP